MKKLIIIGASAGGIELAEYIKEINKREHKWDIIGYFDEDSTRRGYNGIPVLGSWGWIEKSDISEYYFICAIGNPENKKRIVTQLEKRYNARFCNIIHPTALVASTATLGYGIILSPYSVIQANVILENHIYCGTYTCIGHDSIVKSFTTLNPGTIISGYNVINEMVYFGTGAKTIPNITIGENSTLGAGSVLYTNLESYSTAKGIPAKVFFRKR